VYLYCFYIFIIKFYYTPPYIYLHALKLHDQGKSLECASTLGNKALSDSDSCWITELLPLLMDRYFHWILC